MSEIKQKPLPCPLCSAKMKRIKNGYEHPSSQCVLSGFVVTDVEIKKWNTRKPMKRINERLEAQKEQSEKIYNELKDSFYLGMQQADDNAIEIVKEEGGIE